MVRVGILGFLRHLGRHLDARHAGQRLLLLTVDALLGIGLGLGFGVGLG